MGGRAPEGEAAMQSSGGGQPQVVVLDEGSSVVSGTAVQQKLIEAARLFADIVRPTYGPRGLDKMLYKSSGELAVTNDGAKVIAELLVRHPAAKALVALGQSQEAACGDGVTGSVLLATELLSEAEQLLRRGVHPLTVVDGFVTAAVVAAARLDSAARAVTGTDELIAVARTALTGKAADLTSDAIAGLIVEAMELVRRVDDDGRVRARPEDVTMAKARRGAVLDSRILRGVRIDRRLALDSFPDQLEDAHIAVLSCPLVIEQLQRTVEIEIEMPEQLDAFLANEDAQLDARSAALIDVGADVVLTEGEVDRRVMHRLARAGILVVDQLQHSDAVNLARASGARVVDLVRDIEPADLGWAASVRVLREEDEEGIKQHTEVDGCRDPEVVTLVVGGSNDLATEEVIRGLHDAVRVVSVAMEDGRVIGGGGRVHATLAAAVREAAEHVGGRARLGMEAWARGIEAIVGTLASNAGADGLDAVMDMRAAVASGRTDAGVRADGSVGELTGVIEPVRLHEHAMSAATEQAVGMLRVDQVVSRRASGLD